MSVVVIVIAVAFTRAMAAVTLRQQAVVRQVLDDQRAPQLLQAAIAAGVEDALAEHALQFSVVVQLETQVLHVALGCGEAVRPPVVNVRMADAAERLRVRHELDGLAHALLFAIGLGDLLQAAVQRVAAISRLRRRHSEHLGNVVRYKAHGGGHGDAVGLGGGVERLGKGLECVEQSVAVRAAKRTG